MTVRTATSDVATDTRANLESLGIAEDEQHALVTLLGELPPLSPVE